MPNTSFPSKLLLFGEYTIMHGSHALAVPFSKFSGNLEYPQEINELEKQSNKALKDLALFLNKQQIQEFDTVEFLNDINKGLYFNSNIPQGFGLGSSGALVAAVYKKYSNTNITDLNELKKWFALLESYFHGNSSGIDPLVSYIDKPLLFKKNQVTEVEIKLENIAVFLIDTEIPRQTQVMMNIFKTLCKDDDYYSRLQNDYIPMVNTCINDLISHKEDRFFAHLKILSKLQLQLFAPMIPHSTKPVWQSALETGKFCLKLCGAGGGGYILGFCLKENLKEVKKQFKVIL